MLSIFNGIIFSCFIFTFLFHTFFTVLTRYRALKKSLVEGLSSMINSKVSKFIILILFITFFVVNLTGNIPLNSIPTLFYSQTLTVSLLF